MNNNEVVKKIIKHKLGCFNKLSEVYINRGNWTMDMIDKYVLRDFERFYEFLVKEPLDWNSLTVQQCLDLGFCWWTKEKTMLLIPAYLYPVIPVGLELYTISDEKIVNDGKLVFDSLYRFGFLKYGLLHKDLIDDRAEVKEDDI